MSPDNNSKVKFSKQQLETIKAKLLERREQLKNELKTKHAEVYKWLIDHNIDLDNLQKYSKNITAALTLTNQLIMGNLHLAAVPPPTPPQKPDDSGNQNPSDQQQIDNADKAKHVWEEYGNIIEQVAKKYDVDLQLIFATIMTESEGNSYAYRYERHINDASFGLGQILYSTALSMGFTGTPEDIYRPEIAIDLIGKYHRNTIDTYGLLTPEQMTVVYNTGQLFGYPHPGHLIRFREWYYSYKKEEKIVT